MIVLPKLGQGTGYDFSKRIDLNEVVHILQIGISVGLNFIDTAENYGDGFSEEAVGRAMKGIRNKVVVATKFAPGNSSSKALIKSCEGSLKRMGTDYIDLYQIHWPNPTIPLEETFGALFKLKKQGKVREIGVGNFSLKHLKEMNDIIKKEDIFSLQTEYNLFERYIEYNGVSDFCQKNKLKVIAFSPLDQGRVHEFSNQQKKILSVLGRKYNLSLSQILLSWVTHKDDYYAVPKTLSEKHIKENARVIHKRLDENDFTLLNKCFHIPLRFIEPKNIIVDSLGERNMHSYGNIKDAIENKLGLSPSPVELSEEIKEGVFLKPVRLIEIKNKSEGLKYKLISGRIRFWAWIIAFGNSQKIPAYIRKDLTN